MLAFRRLFYVAGLSHFVEADTKVRCQMDIIKTPRLVLRNFQQEDGAGFFAYLNNPVASCFLSLKLATLDNARAEASKRSGSDEYIAVCTRDTERLIGDLFATPEDDTYSVGWNFNPQYGGAGFATEAAIALLDFSS